MGIVAVPKCQSESIAAELFTSLYERLQGFIWAVASHNNIEPVRLEARIKKEKERVLASFHVCKKIFQVRVETPAMCQDVSAS